MVVDNVHLIGLAYVRAVSLTKLQLESHVELLPQTQLEAELLDDEDEEELEGELEELEEELEELLEDELHLEVQPVAQSEVPRGKHLFEHAYQAH